MTRVIDRNSSVPSEGNGPERVLSDSIRNDHIYPVNNSVMDGDREPPAIRLGFKPIPQKGRINERLGKRLSIIYLAVVSIFALTISISLIVAIVSTAKSKSEEPAPTITTASVGGTSTTMSSKRTQTASISVTYSQSISSSKSTLRFSTMTKTKLEPTSRKSTRRSSTTTTNEPQISIHCMFVGDVLNLGRDSIAVYQYYEDKCSGIYDQTKLRALQKNCGCQYGRRRLQQDLRR
ncbi:unnamed protein product [Cylicocyclus nassatus]|uniref:Uncharacterized protein n=1 Tax=Cylicocyclus nassatus TaxID=53992 RepID=A0AA36H7V1_CYLNA|nr:unnamed protein product [Cylicocyclus nassatus]